jgi:LPXTG-motif cell wall-anchored protein
MTTKTLRLGFRAAAILPVAAGALLLAPTVNAQSPAATNTNLRPTAALAGNGNGNDDHKTWICHVVEGQGENGTGYNHIEVDNDSIDGAGNNDHTQHVAKDGRRDIIPAPAEGCPVIPTDPTTPPTDPTTPPTDPKTPPTDPTTPPTDPTTPPADPTTPPTDPTTPPTDPTSPEVTERAVIPPITGTDTSGGSGGTSAPAPTLAPPLGQLAETGIESTAIAMIAGALIFLGGLMVIAGRRMSTR